MDKKQIYRFLREFGFNPRMTISAIKYFGEYRKDISAIKKEVKKDKDWKVTSLFPCLHDKHAESGSASGHYFHQDLLVAQKIFKNNPAKHADIGSSIGGLVAHLASFRKVSVFDIRPLKTQIDNIDFKQLDLMDDIATDALKESFISLSCLHALEHFGLGRYGDRIDVGGHRKGFTNICKMLKKDGMLYFSVPIGEQRIEFNAHRVFSIKKLLSLFDKNNLNIISFSYVDDSGNLHKNVELNKKNINSNLDCSWGCGIFELKKK